MAPIISWVSRINLTWLQKLVQKHPAGASKLGIPGGEAALKSAPGSPLATGAINWIKENPKTFAANLISAGFLLSDASDLFTDDEKKVISEAAANYMDNASYAGNQKALAASLMGDGEIGTLLGDPLEKVLTDAEKIKALVRRVDLLSDVFGIAPSRLNDVIAAIVLFEPEDYIVYKQVKGL